MKKAFAITGIFWAVIACVAAGKTTPVFTSIYPLAVEQGKSRTVAISGNNFAKNTTLVVGGTNYSMKINSSTSGTFTFTPAMTQTVGFLAVQVRTANTTSNTLYFQVCKPLVITTDSIPMVYDVPIGPDGQVQTSGGCIRP